MGAGRYELSDLASVHSGVEALVVCLYATTKYERHLIADSGLCSSERPRQSPGSKVGQRYCKEVRHLGPKSRNLGYFGRCPNRPRPIACSIPDNGIRVIGNGYND
jgi:hypothetical protein